MKLVSVDVGTTSCKAGLFDSSGAALRVVSRPTPTRASRDGVAYYDPEELFQTVCETLREAVDGVSPAEIAAAGIASMAETGVLVDRASGAARSHFFPWFDTQAEPQAELLARQDDPVARFCKTGLHPGPKVSLAKLLWLLERDPAALQGAVWLSAADYVVFRLTGEFRTDYSLAGRTLAFRIDWKCWDDEWIRYHGLSPDIFPPVGPSGEPAGRVHERGHARSGLPVGLPVAVAGHDHICGALGVGAITPRKVFNSMGTAEVLLGTLEPRGLTQRDYESGLSFGCHVVPDRYYWLGGLSVSGGSIEWLRAIFGTPQMSYQQLDQLLAEADYEPTDILYYPYLLGSTSSSLNRRLTAARASFIGLDAHHRQIDLLKAVLQGTAYEMERIRRTAEQLTASPIERVLAAGGGTRNKHWMQIKADVSNCIFEVAPFSDVTLLGAAMIAGIGAGLFAGADEAVQAMAPQGGEVFYPDAARHRRHLRIFEQGYLALQTPLNAFYSLLEKSTRDAYESC